MSKKYLDKISENRWSNASTIQAYNKSMNNSMSEKFIQITSKFPDSVKKNNGNNKVIIDFGTGTGILAYEIAKFYPNAYVIGVDYLSKYVDLALSVAAKYDNLTNINFHKLKANDKEYIFKKKDGSVVKPDVIIFSSVVHEIYSYTNISETQNALEKEYDRKLSVLYTLQQCYKVLNNGGRVIIRDFCGPSKNPYVILQTLHQKTKPKYSFENFAKEFGLLKKNIYKFDAFPILCKLLQCNTTTKTKNNKTYITDYRSIYEFIFHKDFHENWNHEMNERYGFWNENEAVSMFKDAGFDMVFSDIVSGEWIKKTRFHGIIKIQILSENENPWQSLQPVCKKYSAEHFPQYQIIIVGDKI
jgi:ubiquinone/menaquinone biosynthesis C-methylase UbiE